MVGLQRYGAPIMSRKLRRNFRGRFSKECGSKPSFVRALAQMGSPEENGAALRYSDAKTLAAAPLSVRQNERRPAGCLVRVRRGSRSTLDMYSAVASGPEHRASPPVCTGQVDSAMSFMNMPCFEQMLRADRGNLPPFDHWLEPACWKSMGRRTSRLGGRRSFFAAWICYSLMLIASDVCDSKALAVPSSSSCVGLAFLTSPPCNAGYTSLAGARRASSAAARLGAQGLINSNRVPGLRRCRVASPSQYRGAGRSGCPSLNAESEPPRWDDGDHRKEGSDAEELDATLHAIQSIASDKGLSEVERIQKIRELMPAPVHPVETEPGMHGETLVAKSFGHLNELLFLDFNEAASGELSEVGKNRPTRLYRGMPDSSMHLLSSLQRLLGETDEERMRISPNTARRIEEGMVETFRRYAYDTTSLSSDASLWEWLALAQHHGLPTRLVDWTKSPYVALHFATYKASLMSRDSVIWVIDPLRFSNEFAVFREYNQWRQDVGKRRCGGIFSTSQLDSFYKWKTGLDVEMSRPKDFDLLSLPFIFVEPPSLSSRVVNQWGCFQLIRTGVRPQDVLDKMKPLYTDNDDLLGVVRDTSRHSHVFRKIVIPAHLKYEVRDKLDSIGFTERTLFPGLDGLSNYLRRYYTPRGQGLGSGEGQLLVDQGYPDFGIFSDVEEDESFANDEDADFFDEAAYSRQDFEQQLLSLSRESMEDLENEVSEDSGETCVPKADLDSASSDATHGGGLTPTTSPSGSPREHASACHADRTSDDEGQNEVRVQADVPGKARRSRS